MLRRLTSPEIDDILSFIKPRKGINVYSADNIMKNNKDLLREQLTNVKVNPLIIPELKVEIEKSFIKSQVQPGENVGVLCAQGIGEKQTQTTLNTFHKAGASKQTVNTGVPRVKELLDASKNPKYPTCTVILKKKYDTIKEVRDVIKYSIVDLNLNKLSDSISYYDSKERDIWYDVYETIHDCRIPSNGCIRIKLNMELMHEYRIDMITIKDKLENLEMYNISCVYSPAYIGILDLFIDLSDMELSENRLNLKDDSEGVKSYLEECVQYNLFKATLFGIPGISSMYINNDKQSLDASGSNLKYLLGLSFVNTFETYTDNFLEMYNIFGIEVARTYIVEEFLNLMDGINKCHIDLLVDRMTFSGIISPITRFTLKKDDCGPISKATFEETFDNFLRAGIYGEEDSTQGVSASIICGKIPKLGTGMCELMINMDKIK